MEIDRKLTQWTVTFQETGVFFFNGHKNSGFTDLPIKNSGFTHKKWYIIWLVVEPLL